MRRRTLVATLGSVALGSIAGCSGGGGGDEETTTAATDTETATATATATATESATATETSSTTHALDERFVVGEGDATVPYTVHGFRRSSRIGREGIGEMANGVFLIVLLTVENPGDDTMDVPIPRIVVRGDGVRKNVDQDASEKVTNDDRTDESSLALATIPAGQTRTGVLVYDVPPDNSYRIQFTPSGDGPAHTVEVGDIGSVTDLEDEGF